MTAPDERQAGLLREIGAMRAFGISDTVLDQWEQSAASDAQKGESWSAHPAAVMAVLAVVRAALALASPPAEGTIGQDPSWVGTMGNLDD